MKKTIYEKLEDNTFYSPDGCWYWTGSVKGRDGRGYISVCGYQFTVYRLMYEFTRGPITNGLFACHSCDNPKCINPDHLFLGTVKDNSDDFAIKNRARNLPIGEDHKRSILTRDDVFKIRANRESKSLKSLAKEFGLSKTALYQAKIGKTWRHL